MTAALTPDGQPAIHTVATSASLLFQNWMRELLGPRADQSVVGSLSWSGLAIVVFFLSLALLAHWIAAVLMRPSRQSSTPDATAPPARPHVLVALGKPLYVLIWLFSGYFIGSTLPLVIGSPAANAVLQPVLATVLDVGLFVLLFWAFYRLTWILEWWLKHWAARSSTRFDDLVVPLIGRGLRILLPVFGAIFALPLLQLPPRYLQVIDKGTSILLIVALAMVAVQAVQTLETALLERFDIRATDNLRARKVYTQVLVIGRVADVGIALFALASILMLFSEVRHVGTSLLASAGIVGIIAGVAAQKPLANLFAGFQIALAQPMRQDDVVIVEGEWGRVEEITLTYVVVHIWDDRRMVLPLSYFIEKPFQNWTRTSAQLLGSIFVWVDYSFPVEEGRKALKEIIETNPLWDKRFWNLQVSDADEKTMQLRVLATAADSSIAWNLRCDIREKFIAFIQQRHPQSLPRLRTELSGMEAAPLTQS